MDSLVMRKLKFFTHCTLLAATPSLPAYPEYSLHQAAPKTMNSSGDRSWGIQEQAAEWVRPTTYDEIMQMLDDLESGKLEIRYPAEQLERVNEYLVTLAREGILSDEFDEEAVLEEDVEDLMYCEDSAFELTRYLASSNEYMIIPAVLNGYSGYNIVQCGKISKAWKKTKKFCKKHKKAIIIGAVVVVAVTVVAASSASAASAAAGAAGAAAGAGVGSSDSGHSESKKSEAKEESPAVSANPKEAPPPIDTNEALILQPFCRH